LQLAELKKLGAPKVPAKNKSKNERLTFTDLGQHKQADILCSPTGQ
jgi:hypothetical protein